VGCAQTGGVHFAEQLEDVHVLPPLPQVRSSGSCPTACQTPAQIPSAAAHFRGAGGAHRRIVLVQLSHAADALQGKPGMGAATRWGMVQRRVLPSKDASPEGKRKKKKSDLYMGSHNPTNDWYSKPIGADITNKDRMASAVRGSGVRDMLSTRSSDS
jgi:hypothetical protein